MKHRTVLFISLAFPVWVLLLDRFSFISFVVAMILFVPVYLTLWLTRETLSSPTPDADDYDYSPTAINDD